MHGTEATKHSKKLALMDTSTNKKTAFKIAWTRKRIFLSGQHSLWFQPLERGESWAYSQPFFELLLTLIYSVYFQSAKAIPTYNTNLFNHSRKSNSASYIQMHGRKRKKRNAKRKILIQWKEAYCSQVGPNPESYGSFKNSELNPNLLAFH